MSGESVGILKEVKLRLLLLSRPRLRLLLLYRPSKGPNMGLWLLLQRRPSGRLRLVVCQPRPGLHLPRRLGSLGRPQLENEVRARRQVRLGLPELQEGPLKSVRPGNGITDRSVRDHGAGLATEVPVIRERGNTIGMADLRQSDGGERRDMP